MTTQGPPQHLVVVEVEVEGRMSLPTLVEALLAHSAV